MNTAVLISGRGSNLASLLAYEKANKANYRIVLVLSNEPEASGLAYAKENKVPYYVVPHRDYQSKQAFEAAMQVYLEKHNIELIALAGFMRLLSSSFITRWQGRVINIHPSLLPDFPGLNTHKKVLQAKKKESGCSVFFVDSGIDTGLLINQTSVPVLVNDTEETLAKRVLQEEHILFPKTLDQVASKQITLENLQTNKQSNKFTTN